MPENYSGFPRILKMPFPIISEKNPLVLASASPRRRRLLAQAGIPCRVFPSRVPEHGESGEPDEVSLALALEKAARVSARAGALWVLGADTVVTIDGRILGKPEDGAEAKKMLSLLGGREHRVITGFCVLDPSGGAVHSETVTTLVHFKPLAPEEIQGYIETEEPFGKAGSYAIQGIGSFMVESISGSYTNVVGLPLCALIKALVSKGALGKFPQ